MERRGCVAQGNGTVGDLAAVESRLAAAVRVIGAVLGAALVRDATVRRPENWPPNPGVRGRGSTRQLRHPENVLRIDRPATHLNPYQCSDACRRRSACVVSLPKIWVPDIKRKSSGIHVMPPSKLTSYGRDLEGNPSNSRARSSNPFASSISWWLSQKLCDRLQFVEHAAPCASS
jgi:hypothetical protein